MNIADKFQTDWRCEITDYRIDNSEYRELFSIDEEGIFMILSSDQ